MALQLKLNNGETKKYSTWHYIYAGEYSPGTYKTKCGMRLDRKPKPEEECNHIDCAINATENNIQTYFYHFVFFAGMFSFFALADQRNLQEIVFIYPAAVFAALLFSIPSIYSRSKLIEFKNRGTIDGIDAKILD